MGQAHKWEDLSHHGSPQYFCEYCSVARNSAAAELDCVSAELCLARERSQQELRDYITYCEMRRARELYQQLHDRFAQRYEQDPSNRP